MSGTKFRLRKIRKILLSLGVCEGYHGKKD